jgi:filamentous hemagglutinin family protein
LSSNYSLLMHAGRAHQKANGAIYRNSTAILAWMLCAGALLAGSAQAGDPLPSGGAYAAGSGTISNSTNATTINQSTTYGIINWKGFSIGNGKTVQFNNGSGATLNRVTGGAVSNIDGQLNATGSVFVINPQGVVVGPSGKVVTNGSFVASTRDVSDKEFMSGGKMTARGTSNGDVVNAGVITSKTGDVILVGRNVHNTGAVSAANGTAAMAAGNEIVLQPVGSDSRIAIAGGSGDVTNEGTVTAAQARLQSAGGNVYALAGNNGGLVAATGSTTIDGHVWLTAGGNVNVTGAVVATNANGSGGTVSVAGTDIAVSGTISASATAAGMKGGSVSVIGTGATTVGGKIAAAGKGAAGGFIETSGGTLSIGGAAIDAGDGGNWLLDPSNLTVDSAAATTINTSLGGNTNVTLTTTSSGTSGPGTVTSGAGDIIVNSALSWSTKATLTLNAYHDIDINAPITVGGGGTLTLKYGYDYAFGANGSASFTGGSSAKAKLNINSSSYTLLYSMGDLQSINSKYSLLDGIDGNYALATSLDASSTTSWSAIGTSVRLIGGFSGTFTGLGHTISNLNLSSNSDNFGLFGYVTGMVRDIGLVGGSVGGHGDYVGALVGASHYGTVKNAWATTSVSGSDYIGGLVGLNDGGDIINAHASGVVSGSNYVGGLAGQSNEYIANSYATGRVTGSGDYIGGLVGSASDTISGSYATGTVSGKGSVGGLAGYNSGTISSSYATGNVSGSDNYVGGLVGYTTGDVDASYATGTVTGTSNKAYIGGLAGYTNGSDVSNSYATGAVSGADDIGGLIGYQTGGSVTNSSASGSVTGRNYNVGGLIGNSTLGTVAYSYATGTVSGGGYVGGLVGWSVSSSIHDSYAMGAVLAGFTGNVGTKQYVGGLIGLNSGSVKAAYSTGPVIVGSSYSDVGGLIGKTSLGSVSNSYWDTQTSGWTSSDGGSGRTTAQLQGALPGGFSSSVWSTGAGLYPYLSWQGSLQAVSGTVYSDAGNTALGSSAAGLVTVSALRNGAAAGSATAGANGYYYIVMPSSSLTGAGQVVTYLTGNSVKANTYVQNASGRVSGADLYGSYLRILSGAAKTSDMFAGLATAVGSNVSSDLLYVGGKLAANTSLDIVSASTAGFDIDSAINAGTGTVILDASGLVTESTGSIVAQYLELLGTNGRYQLTGNNDVDILAANTGDVSVTDRDDIIVGTVNKVAGIASTGAVSVVAKGNVTVVSGAKVTAGANKNVELAAGGNFINNRGSDAVNVSGNGRWLIYSNDPAGDQFGGLNSGNTAVWNAVYGNTITQNGNRYVFAVQPTLTVTTTNVNKVYGNDASAAVAAAYTTSGYQAGVAGAFLGDTAASVYSGAPLVTSTGADMHANVATYGITATAGSMTLLNGYKLAFNNAGILTVGKRDLNITANNQSRAYGDANPDLTYTVRAGDLKSWDSLSGALLTTADERSDVGSYAIKQGSLLASNNYNLIFTAGTLTVGQRDLNIRADDKSRVYGDANPDLTYTVRDGDLKSWDSLSGALLTTADERSNVGGYAIEQGSLLASNNYNLIFTKGTLTIGQRDLNIRADDQSRAYGDPNSDLTYTVRDGDLKSWDSLSGTLVTTADERSNVGSYAIEQGGLLASNNYNLIFTPGTLTVTPRNLTITADDQSRAYGDANPDLTYTFGGSGPIPTLALAYMVGGQGLVNGDTLTGALETVANERSNVGWYWITQGSLAASPNYNLIFQPGKLTVFARDITIKADDKSKIYGNANPDLTYTVGGKGLVNGDTLTGALTTSVDGTTGIGSYDITQGDLGASNNYNVTAFNPGTLTVLARDLTITADDKSKIYGNDNPDLTYQIGGMGLVNGDTLTGVLTTGVDGKTGIGKYGIDQGSLAASTNYAVTFNPGALTVLARDLTITADDKSKIYGNANPDLTYQIGGMGLVNGDTLTGALTTGVDGKTGIGKYGIDQGSLAASTNYAVTFNPGNLTVLARDLTITADGKSKIYGNDNPALTYTVGGMGLVNGDTLTGALVTGVNATTGIGSYGIDQGSLNASANYNVTFTPGTLTVLARDLTITADSKSKIYGSANPALTYQIGGLGLVNGDSLTGGLATVANVASGVGAYAITLGSLAVSNNYNLAYVGNLLTVTPATLTITAMDVSARSLADVAFLAGYSGFVNGQNSTIVNGLAYALQADATNPLAYGINPYGATAANYTIKYVAGRLTLVQPDKPINTDTTTSSALGPVSAYRASNVVTAATGGGVQYLLFQLGVPGQISPFQPVAVGDYSNAISGEDRLVGNP